MAIGRKERRDQRRPRVAEEFAEGLVETALDLLELTELAWHDCYGEVTPPDAVIDDILLTSSGSIQGLVGACRLAIIDRRDLRVMADKERESR